MIFWANFLGLVGGAEYDQTAMGLGQFDDSESSTEAVQAASFVFGETVRCCWLYQARRRARANHRPDTAEMN